MAKGKELWAAVHFDFESEDQKLQINSPKDWSKITKISYKIRQTIDSIPSTSSVTPGSWKPGPRNSPIAMMYINGGFLYLQDMIDHAIIEISKMHNDGSLDHPSSELYGPDISAGSWLQMHPYPCYRNDNFLSLTVTTLPLFLTIAWLYSVSMLVKDIVQEKESRLKEVMKMMGMRNSSHWLGWFVLSFTTSQVTVFILSLVLKFGKILPHSSIFMVNLWLGSYCVSIICFAFLMSCFFSKANMAAACSGLIYNSLYMPYMLLENWDLYLGYYSKRLWSLICSISFAYGCNAVSQLEMQGEGLQWENLNYKTSVTRLSMAESIVYLWIDSLLYIVLVWYLENAFPGEFGIAKPWYFPVSLKYWSGIFGFSSHDAYRSDFDSSKKSVRNIQPAKYGNIPFEEEPTDLRLGATIQNLSKKYKKSNKFAIKNLNINFYKGQITSFLGQNGAGKTTTMSIMCGLFPPTSGTVYINGYDVRSEIEAIRKDLGFCPQHNVLFESLTVEEHICFFAALKGKMKSKQLFQSELNQILKDTSLQEKRNFLPSQLSGGMKRKLSVATAFVGGSKCIILDEPTAGVDPYARRGIWDLLTRYKKGKTIILCTHHMDEADLLGDRIAIMLDGQLKTIGSSHWLKSQYGDGFALTLVKKKNFNQQTIQAVQGFVPKLVQNENTLTELTLTLPFAARANNMFTRLFRYLDENMSMLGVSSYGIGDVTLEQSFLKVTSKLENADTKTKRNIQRGYNRKSPKTQKIESRFHLLVQQFKHLFIRRFNNSKRSRRDIFTQLILPPLFILNALSMQYISILPKQLPSLILNPEMYEGRIFGHEKIYSFYANEKAFKSDLRVSRQDYDPYGMKDWKYYFPYFKTNENGTVDTFTEACNRVDDKGKILPLQQQDQNCVKSLILNLKNEQHEIKKDSNCTQADSLIDHYLAGTGGKAMAKINMKSNLQDLYLVENGDIPDWIVKSEYFFNSERFGGITSNSRNNLAINPEILSKYLEIITKSDPNSKKEITDYYSNLIINKHASKAWFMNFGTHSSPAYLSALHNGVLKQINRKLKIETISHPFEFRNNQINIDAHTC